MRDRTALPDIVACLPSRETQDYIRRVNARLEKQKTANRSTPLWPLSLPTHAIIIHFRRLGGAAHKRWIRGVIQRGEFIRLL